MNIVSETILKTLRRKVYPLLFRQEELPSLPYEADMAKSQEMIASLLQADKPCMVARFGSNELAAVVNYIGVQTSPHSPWKYVKGEVNEWWWDRKMMNFLRNNAGFFPLTEDSVRRFAQLMIDDAREVDLLGCWLKEEWHLRQEMKGAQRVKLSNLEPPYLYDDKNIPSWTNAIRGKKVLVVHPFAETIRKQYDKRRLLFRRDDILPDFELLTLKAVQSIGGKSEFGSWFDALQWMEGKMDATDYDVCLIGCGAYGFPLGAHAKRTGHKAVHLGGALQLLFGIKGRRWEERPQFSKMFNEHWVRPSEYETPTAAASVERGCYW